MNFIKSLFLDTTVNQKIEKEEEMMELTELMVSLLLIILYLLQQNK